MKVARKLKENGTHFLFNKKKPKRRINGTNLVGSNLFLSRPVQCNGRKEQQKAVSWRVMILKLREWILPATWLTQLSKEEWSAGHAKCATRNCNIVTSCSNFHRRRHSTLVDVIEEWCIPCKKGKLKKKTEEFHLPQRKKSSFHIRSKCVGAVVAAIPKCCCCYDDDDNLSWAHTKWHIQTI